MEVLSRSSPRMRGPRVTGLEFTPAKAGAGKSGALCPSLVSSSNGGTRSNRIYLTRVTRILHDSVFCKFALAAHRRRQRRRCECLACYFPVCSCCRSRYGPVISLPRYRFLVDFRSLRSWLLYFPVIYRETAGLGQGVGPHDEAGTSDIFVDGAAGDAGADHAAFELGFVERRVLAFRFELGGIEHPRHVGIEHDHVGGASLPQRAGRKA